jgi:hypothetical protein
MTPRFPDPSYLLKTLDWIHCDRTKVYSHTAPYVEERRP